MKDTHFLYSITILAVIGVLICFIGYATNSLPMHTQKETPVVTTTAKKKNCACCAEETADIVKAIRQNREKMLAHRERYTRVTDTLKQYGVEEGLRRIRQLDPEVVAQIERFFLQHPTENKNVGSSP